MEPEVTLMEVLQAREARASRQQGSKVSFLMKQSKESYRV